MKDLRKMTDEELAVAYSEGNDMAFDVLLEHTQDKIYSYIMFVVRDEHIADDVFQDTFVKAIVCLREGRYSTTGKFAAWLMRIAHNIIIDMYRAQKHENIVEPTEGNDLSILSSPALTEQAIEAQLIEEQNCRDARRIMEMLPDSQREMVYMRLYQQMSFKEIAEITGMSINTALGRMRYAVLNMRRLYKANC